MNLEVRRTAIRLLILAFCRTSWQIHLPLNVSSPNLPAEEMALLRAGLSESESKGWLELINQLHRLYQLTYSGKCELERLNLVKDGQLTPKGKAISELLTLSSTLFNPLPSGTAIDKFEHLKNQTESIVQLYKNSEPTALAEHGISWEAPELLGPYDIDNMMKCFDSQLEKIVLGFEADLDYDRTDKSSKQTAKQSINPSPPSIHIGSVTGNIGVIAGSMSNIDQLNVDANSMQESSRELVQSLNDLITHINLSTCSEANKTQAIERITDIKIEIDKPAAERKKWKITEGAKGLFDFLTIAAEASKNWQTIKPIAETIIGQIQNLSS